MQSELPTPPDNNTNFILGLSLMLIGYLLAVVVSQFISGYAALPYVYCGWVCYGIGSILILLSKRRWWVFFIIVVPIFITLVIIQFLDI